MATLSDLEEVKEALDKGLVSQAEFDEVKRDYLRAKKEALEFQKRELRAKEVYLQRELHAKEEFQKKELRAKEEALEFQKKGISEFQKKELRAKEETLEFQKKELRAKEEALEFQKRELIAKEELQQRKADADLRAYALESIVKHGSSIMSEEQKIDLVRDYAKVSGLDGGATVNDEHPSKRQRVSAEKSDASPPQPPTPPAPADAPAPVVAKQARAPRRSNRFRSMSALVKEKEAAAAASEDGNYSDDDGEDDSDDDERRTGNRWKRWTEEEDAALVAALRAGQRVTAIKIGGRPAGTAQDRLRRAKANGSGSPALREYLEETCPEYIYKPPSERVTLLPLSVEEDQTFIQAHREGKLLEEIAAMLPRRTYSAVYSRWREAKKGQLGTAALLAYAAAYCKLKRPISREDRASLLF